MTPGMINAFGILYGIALVVGIIVFLDWLGRRKDRAHANEKHEF